MRFVRNGLWIAPLFLSCFSAFASKPSSFNNMEFSVAGGYSWPRTSSTSLIVSPFETDSVQVSNMSNSSMWKVGAGYYLFTKKLKHKKYFNKLLVGLNLYRVSSTINGNVWQYQFSQFNNYSFRAPLTSYRLMLDIKPTFFTYHHVSPYAILGVGLAWNKLAYYETVTGSGVDPNSYNSLGSHTTTAFAYDLGLGIQAEFTKHLSASLEYIYMGSNNFTPASTSSTGTSLMKPPTFSVRNQAALLGLNWKV